jgi:hypothetical protein
MRKIRKLANLSLDARLALIAEGLPVILRSAQDLVAASESLADHPRAAEVLSRHGEEEAAKILILLDYVRCPPRLSDRAAEMLSAFYDHGARMIYAEACGWKPTNVAMVRQYVDSERVSHYIEGDMGQWIVPNWQLHSREAVLYADLTCSDDGGLDWNDPHSWDDIKIDFGVRPIPLQVTEALSRLGVFSIAGLRLVAGIWGAVAFTEFEGWEIADGLIRATVEGLEAQHLTTEAATNEDVQTLYRLWQCPMYDLEFKPIKVSLLDLKAEQERYFCANFS